MKRARAKNPGKEHGRTMVSGDPNVLSPWGLHDSLYSGHWMDTGVQWGDRDEVETCLTRRWSLIAESGHIYS